ncbi:hypothetical protein Tco_0633544 [Tanacetum coccineum]
MLMEPYYIQCIKDGPFKPNTTEDDIIESIISCETAKATWTDLIHNFEVSLRSGSASLRDLDISITLRPLTLPISMEGEPKIQKDYKAEYKKMKAKLALLEASLSTSQPSKPFQSKNKGLVVETFDWDEEEVSDDEEETQVKVLMALADDELSVGKNHARNGEWIDITMKKGKTVSIDDEERNTNKSWVFMDLADELKWRDFLG